MGSSLPGQGGSKGSIAIDGLGMRIIICLTLYIEQHRARCVTDPKAEYHQRTIIRYIRRAPPVISPWYPELPAIRHRETRASHRWPSETFAKIFSTRVRSGEE